MRKEMKRIIMTILALALMAGASAQTTKEDFQRRYQNLVDRVGAGGIGVEPLLIKWEAAFPEDLNMLEAKFSYYLQKSVTPTIIILSQDRYLGREPVVPLKDSTGRSVNYFEDYQYSDSLFALAGSALDKAISIAPSRFDYRLAKTNSYIGYEKESPDMALQYILGIVAYNYSSKPEWTYPGMEKVDNEVFCALIQDCCYSFFRIGSPFSQEAFRQLSEEMLRYNKDNPLFLDNMGSYWLVAKRDSKKALKYYNKVLKKHPDDLTAIRNCILLARNDKNIKLEKKYLPMLVKYGETENDRNSAKARLTALSLMEK